MNELSDEELDSLLNAKFFSIQKKVNEMTSVAPVFRLIERAKELEKSEKLISMLQLKLAELQEKEYSSQDNEV